MLKKYTAKNSVVCLSVPLATGGSTRVSFSPLTGDGSVYYTSDEAIQKGLESHQAFGKLFKLEPVKGATSQQKAGANGSNGSNGAAGQKGQPVNESKEQQVAEAFGAAKKAVIKKEVACNDDAKEYLAEKFGISRTNLRTRTAIEVAAKAHGVEFVWI